MFSHVLYFFTSSSGLAMSITHISVFSLSFCVSLCLLEILILKKNMSDFEELGTHSQSIGKATCGSAKEENWKES